MWAHTEFEAESLIENADNYRHGTDHLQLGLLRQLRQQKPGFLEFPS